MSVNPVDIFQGCFSQIERISLDPTSRDPIHNIKVSLASLFFSVSNELDFIRDDIGALRDRIDCLEPEDIKKNISSIWNKWFEGAAQETSTESLQFANSSACSSQSLVSLKQKESLPRSELKKLIDKWKELSQCVFENLEISSFDDSLILLFLEWMTKISRGSDFRSQNSQKKIARLVLSIIEYANLDEEFCQLCRIVIDNATGRCQDGGVLGLNVLSLEKRVRQSGAITLESLLKLLKGVYIASLLEEMAIKIVYDISLSSRQKASMDPIEVFLALQVIFKDTFELPFECENMDFFDMALLTDEKIKEIEKSIKMALNDQESLAQFLLEQYSWKYRLETVYALEISSIQEGLFQKLDLLDEEKERLPSLTFIDRSNELKEEYNDVMKVWFKSKTEETINSFKPINGKKRKISDCIGK